MNSDNNHNSFIHDLQIASPCKADWNTMTGDERKRFCQACKLNVYNISAMTLPEAEKLVSESEGRLCLKMYRRKDGTVITQDCPLGVAEKVKRKLARALAVSCAATAVLLTWIANSRQPNPGYQLPLVDQIKEKCSALAPGYGEELGGVTPAAVHRARTEVVGQMRPIEQISPIPEHNPPWHETDRKMQPPPSPQQLR